MTGLNVDWALGELDKFIQQTVMTNNSYVGNGRGPNQAHPDPGCRWGRNPPASRSDRAM